MIRIVFIGFFLMLVSALPARAQDITNLNPKVRILSGEAFYIHHVLEGQTIEQIARAYVSSTKEILKHNPSAQNLASGMKLRIPYSDASATVMSKYDLKLDEELSAAVYAEEPELDEAAPPVQPIEEASDLVYTPQTEQPLDEAPSVQPVGQENDGLEGEDENEQAVIAELSALSSTLQSGLSSLQSAEEQVKSKPFLDEEGFPQQPDEETLKEASLIRFKGMLLAEFLEAQVQPMLDGTHASGADVLLKEFFLVRINQEGVITNVRDERTDMNGNTMLLEPDTLKGYQLIENPALLENQFQSIGLVAEINRDTIPVKFKQNGPKFLERVPRPGEADMVIQYGAQKQLWGKYDVVIADAKYYLATYDQVEYNPFGEIRRKIYFNSEKRVSTAILK